MEEKKTEFWLTKVWGIEDGYFFGLIKKLNDKFGEEDWFQEYYEG